MFVSAYSDRWRYLDDLPDFVANDSWLWRFCRNADTLKRLNDLERRIKDQKEQAYINLDKSNEGREKGNQVTS